MLKLYLSHYQNNPTFAISFVMTVHDRKINLKNKAIHENLNWLLLFIILLIPIKSISAKRKRKRVTEKSGVI